MIMKQPHIQNDFKFLDLSDTLSIKSDRDATSSHISKAGAQSHTDSFTQCHFFTASNLSQFHQRQKKNKQEKGITDKKKMKKHICK